MGKTWRLFAGLGGTGVYALASFTSMHQQSSGTAILLAVLSIFGLGAVAYVGAWWVSGIIAALTSLGIFLVSPSQNFAIVPFAIGFALLVGWWSKRSSSWPLTLSAAFLPIAILVLVSLNLSATLALRLHPVTTHSVYALVVLYLATPPWEWAVTIVTLTQSAYLATFIRQKYSHRHRLAAYIGLGVLVGIGMIFLTALIVSLEAQGLHIHVVANNPFVTTPGLREHRIVPAILVAVGVIVLAPVAEEALFRGILFSTLAVRWGYVPGTLVSAAIFGLAHLDITLFIPLAVAGIVLNALYRSTKSLIPGTVAHMTLNAVSVVTALGLMR